jgi:NADPH:quinone reductase-like Zn-dependent oxidoreductase
MQALYISAHGTVDTVVCGDIPMPSIPPPGEVRVATRAAALNRLDLFVISGIPGVRLSFPHVLGADGAGLVDAVGEGAGRYQPGDRVMLNPLLWCGKCEFCVRGEHSLCLRIGIMGEHSSGTLARYFTAPETNLEPLPEGVSFEEAAAFSLVFQTAWRMLISRARLLPGEDILIHGVGGGVSTACLQIARLIGARCFVTSGSDEKLRRARELGAEHVYNYRAVDVVAEVLRETGKRGVDVVVDSVGAETWIQSLKAVRRGGRVLTCGATTGPNPATEIRLIFWKQISILGSTMSNQNEYRTVVQLLARRQLLPIIDRVFPLSRGRDALEYLRDGRQFGKVVVRVDDERPSTGVFTG